MKEQQTLLPNPDLRLTRVHITGLKGLAKLELPGEGIGWSDRIPSTVLIGGVNGSGKTTLLECIARAAHLLISQEVGIPEEVDAAECLVEFSLTDGNTQTWPVRFLVGNQTFVDENRSVHCYGYVKTGKRPKYIQEGNIDDLRQTLRSPFRFARSAWPRLVFFPSEKRDLVVPKVKYKSPGRMDDSAGFVFWWERPTDQQWNGTTFELFFSARWADLNAKEAGSAKEAVNFERYAAGIRDMTAGRKELGWTTSGELVAKIRGGASHPISGLSSGERHVVLLLAELRRLWRRGSLIMIDEPELHLHDAWQIKLYEAILSMQHELGGQCILATQSHHLFDVGDSGSKVLLTGGGLR